MPYWSIPRLWEGRTAVVMASGASLKREDAAAVRHLPRVVTNATFRMAPDAEVIYGSDALFWHNKAYQDVWSCPGFKVSVETHAGLYPNTPPAVLVLRNAGQAGFVESPTHIRTGSNSGYAAIHLAANAGARRILLLGLDLVGDHWHGKHPDGLSNPRPLSFPRWIRHFEALAPELRKRGIEVLNCSPVSALTCFRKVALSECL